MSESQNIEWKETWRDEYLKWVCGFANAQGGILEIGKRDVASIELSVPTYTEQRAIAAILSDMDAEIVALERRKDKARALKQGIM